jgi:hypothetical protein
MGQSWTASANKGHGGRGRLACDRRVRHPDRVELPIEREDVQAIMGSLLQAHWKLDQILGYLFGEDDEEEEPDHP